MEKGSSHGIMGNLLFSPFSLSICICSLLYLDFNMVIDKTSDLVKNVVLLQISISGCSAQFQSNMGIVLPCTVL